ncbi:hypothetical protein [Methanobacterium formicicum]|uniref:hypothetical protein n=1 Tax=Methanobacterium formicicum TaxID=2162 RepID=UPI00064E7EFA|nr:hypothetical protein [Methanobacterium formicicum]
MSVTLVLIPMAIAAVGTMGVGTLINNERSITEEEEDKIKTQLLQENNKSQVQELNKFKTLMRNSQILQESVINLGYQVEILDTHKMEINTDSGSIILFEKDENDVFQALVRDKCSQTQIESYVSEIYDEYTTIVQQKTYQKLVEKIKDRNLHLESEEVTEDNSIVLTLVVED